MWFRFRSASGRFFSRCVMAEGHGVDVGRYNQAQLAELRSEQDEITGLQSIADPSGY